MFLFVCTETNVVANVVSFEKPNVNSPKPQHGEEGGKGLVVDVEQFSLVRGGDLEEAVHEEEEEGVEGEHHCVVGVPLFFCVVGDI